VRISQTGFAGSLLGHPHIAVAVFRAPG
jgi:hypothetical protein